MAGTVKMSSKITIFMLCTMTLLNVCSSEFFEEEISPAYERGYAAENENHVFEKRQGRGKRAYHSAELVDEERSPAYRKGYSVENENHEERGGRGRTAYDSAYSIFSTGRRRRAYESEGEGNEHWKS